MMADAEGIHLEPSALAGVPGMGLVCSPAGAAYVEANGRGPEPCHPHRLGHRRQHGAPEVWQGYYDLGAEQ